MMQRNRTRLPGLASTALCVCATEGVYTTYAQEFFRSAEQHFHPTENVTFHLLPADERPWPYPTMMRHHILLENWPDDDYVFLADADLLCEQTVGSEILPFVGTTAVQHPGFIGMGYDDLPYERNPESACHVPEGEGLFYYAGGFVGGTNTAMRFLSSQIAMCIELDLRRNFIPTWHDESALNRVLAVEPPEVILSPAYLHPDTDDHYVKNVWDQPYDRLIVAVDKTAEVRGSR